MIPRKMYMMIDYVFGGSLIGTMGIWMMELTTLFDFNLWIKNAVGLTALLLGLFKIYDWIEKKCTKYRRLKRK